MIQMFIQRCALMLAGFGAFVSADAIDVSANPATFVDYVQICDAYGTGYFTVPGSDTCLKVSGSVVIDLMTSLHDDFEGLVPGLGWARNVNGIAAKVDTGLMIEAITNTEFGPLQSFLAARSRFTTHENANTTRLTEAWIKWGGLTIGMHPSYYTSYLGGSDVVFSSVAGVNRDQRLDFAVGASGANSLEGKPILIAYTAAFGNGLSASVSLELPIETRNITVPGIFISPFDPYYAGIRMPDLIAQFRVEQAWGFVQAMGALHQVQSSRMFFAFTGKQVDTIGYAIGLGAQLNIPGFPGEAYLAVQASIARGAVKFIDPSAFAMDFYGDGGLPHSWGAVATLHTSITKTIAFEASTSYGRHERKLLTYDTWTGKAHIDFEPAENFSLRTGVEYRRDRQLMNPGSSEAYELIGFFRVTRRF